MRFGDRGGRDELLAAIRSASGMARSMLDEMLGFVDEYLDEGAPLRMLERGVGGPEGDRLAPAACGGTVSTRRGPSQEPGATRRVAVRDSSVGAA
jgi:hypothetical protein